MGCKAREGLSLLTLLCNCRNVLYTGKPFDPDDVESALEAVTAKTVREACMKYIYDKCPAVVGYGECFALVQNQQLFIVPQTNQ